MTTTLIGTPDPEPPERRVPDYDILRAGRSVREGRNALYRQRGPVPTGQDELVGMVDSSSLADAIADRWSAARSRLDEINDVLGVPRGSDPVQAARRLREDQAAALQRERAERERYRPDTAARQQVDAIATMLRERGALTGVPEPVDHALRRYLRLRDEGRSGEPIVDPAPGEEMLSAHAAALLAEVRADSAALRERLSRVLRAAGDDDG